MPTTQIFAQVYKHVDEKGNITYSDVPQKKGDKPISLPEPTTYKPDAPKSSIDNDKNKSAIPKTIQYELVAITSPANDATVRSNSGDISVQISSNPALQGDSVYVVFLDGSEIQRSSAASLTLTNVDRGSHTVSVEIQDSNDQVLVASEPVTFHLFRHSVVRH